MTISNLVHVTEIEDYLTVADIATRVGIKPGSWRRYVVRGDAPQPDRHLGRTPLWLTSTVDDWAASRPGQGAGGGPKPKETK